MKGIRCLRSLLREFEKEGGGAAGAELMGVRVKGRRRGRGG